MRIAVRTEPEELPEEFAARIRAATAHARVRIIQPSPMADFPERYEVHALSGDRLVWMILAFRPDLSVYETTETHLLSQLTAVEMGADDALVQVAANGGERSLVVPLEIGWAVLDELGLGGEAVPAEP